jgi:hypothetical protein
MSFTGLMLAGTALQMHGQLQQGKQEQQMFEYNAAINRQRSELVRQAGNLKIQQMQRERKSFGKKQTALYAKAGVALTGSPLQVLSDTASQLELDILVEDYNTRLEIMNQNSEAQMNSLRGNMAVNASRTAAFSTLLTALPSFVKSGNLGSVRGGTNLGGGRTTYGIAVPSRLGF